MTARGLSVGVRGCGEEMGGEEEEEMKRKKTRGMAKTRGARGPMGARRARF